MRYKSVIVTKRGGPEVLQVIENDLRAPSAGEARVEILATCVCLPDVQARYGHSPFAPKIPFVPGYAIIGVVDALGEGVTNAAVGDREAALTVYGGYTGQTGRSQDVRNSIQEQTPHPDGVWGNAD